MLTHGLNWRENKENEDVFNKRWSWCPSKGKNDREMDTWVPRIDEEDNLNWDQCFNSHCSVSAHKIQAHEPSFCSAIYETTHSLPQNTSYFGVDEPPGRDTLLFKCREAIESLQEEIEEHQKALNDRDFLLSQAQEREEQLVKSKKSANTEISNLKDKIEKLKEEMRENEEKYEKDCHKLIEENKKLKLENIEHESMVNKYKLKLDSIEETVNDLKLKKSSLEDSNEKLESKIKDMKMTINEYETANQQLDTKLLWAEKTYEEGLNKMMNEYERKREIIQKQNQELLDKTQNERIVREEKIKAEMKEKILEIQKGIEASNEEIKKLRNDKQKLLEENMKLTQMMSEVKVTFDAPPTSNEKWYGCHNCNSNELRQSVEQEFKYELKSLSSENDELKTKNKKLEKHLDGLKEQVWELKNELLELKNKKKDKMQKVREEAEKYKEYFRYVMIKLLITFEIDRK